MDLDEYPRFYISRKGRSLSFIGRSPVQGRQRTSDFAIEAMCTDKREPVEKSLDIASLEDGKTSPAKRLLSYSTHDNSISELRRVRIALV